MFIHFIFNKFQMNQMYLNIPKKLLYVVFDAIA